jgi:putative transposase
VCRDVYNSLLNERKYDYEVLGTSPSRCGQNKHFPVWSKEFPEIGSVHSQVLQDIAMRVDLAFKAFFSRVKKGDTPGFPRFKGDGYDSFTYPQSGFKIDENAQSVYLSKIGHIKAVLHRNVEGRVKTCTIRRQSNKWYVCFAVELEVEPLPDSNEAVGVDVGLNQFAALSNGEMVENPRFFRNDQKALAKAQRKLSKQKRGSQDRRKAKKVVRRIHERTANRRHNFVHQAARKLVNQFGLIAVEKLNVKGMVKNHSLAKSISDAAWSMFRQVLISKAESAGRRVVEVNPAYTSQDCSGCGYRAKKKLSERWHFCPNCGLSLDRDTNAALNILKIGMGQHTVAGIPA